MWRGGDGATKSSDFYFFRLITPAFPSIFTRPTAVHVFALNGQLTKEPDK
jgi:hypothetical protein